jgi:hypothetical protein
MQQDPLAALHPLREPEAITWWPLAAGWWLLAVIAVAALTFLLIFLYRSYRARAYRRTGAVHLSQLYADYEQHRDTTQFVSQGNALLKSVALNAFPADRVAASHGENWMQFLNDSTTGREEFDLAIGTAIYQPKGAQVDAESFHRAAQHWIRHHRVTA